MPRSAVAVRPQVARPLSRPVRQVRGNVIQWRQPRAAQAAVAVPVPGEDGQAQTISGPALGAIVALGFLGGVLAFAGQWVGAL